MQAILSLRPAFRRLGLLVALFVAGCGGRQATPEFNPTVTPRSPPLPLSQVFVLESSGALPPDTVVTFRGEESRVIAVRREAPDNSLFVRVSFPAGSLVPRSGDSVTVRLKARPGLYGVDLDTEALVAAGARITFSYGIDFVSPVGAREAYGSDIRFEQFLGVGRLGEDSTLVFLDSWRTGSDLLVATIPGPGRYLIAAPRTPPGFKAIVF